MKRLYFVRHGQSEANVARVFAGSFDSPLTALGRKQARLAGKDAQSLTIDHIISSPLSRAHDTAKIIAEAIGLPPNDIELNSLLIERHYGELEGRAWEMDMNLDDFVDIETVDSVMERAKLVYEHLQVMPHDTVLVVSHGTFGRALREAIHPHMPWLPEDEATRFENAKIVQLL